MPSESIADLLASLRSSLRAGRVTLRRDEPDPRNRNFAITDELLAPGVLSIKDEDYVDIFTSPVAREVASGQQVVQCDSASCFPDDEEFQSMLTAYGGMGAQIVTPVFVGGGVRAIVSVHHLGAPRQWTADEIAACTDAAERIGALIRALTV